MWHRKNNKTINIENNIRFLASQLELKDQKVVFFLGAGVSYTSGLPLGNTLRDLLLMKLYPDYPSFKQAEEFRKSFYLDYPEQHEVTLEMVLQQLGQRLGCQGIIDFLVPFFNNIKEPTLSHQLIASLAKKKFISLVLTTNFDNLLEEALQREEIDFKVISDRDAYALNQKGNVFTIWKLHGDLKQPQSLCVTQKDVIQFPVEKRNALYKIFQNYSIVFLGYSMRDPDVKEVINEVPVKEKKYGFFWIDPIPLLEIINNNLDIRDIISKFNISQNYIKMTSDEFFNEINYLLNLRPPAIIWKADEAKLLRGGVRGINNPWNRDCPPYTRIFGASPRQENYSDWEGATIQLQANLRTPLKLEKTMYKGAALRIEIPRIDGKGIHGKKGGRVFLYLKTEAKKIKISEMECIKFGYLKTYWPHDDRNRRNYPEFFIDSRFLKHFDSLQNITLELEIERQVCMDVSRFLLYFF